MRSFNATRLSFLALALGAILSAQQPSNVNDTSVAPRLIRHNGVFPGFSRQSQSGATGVTFSIYRQQFDGTPLWTEIQNVQPDKDGNYTVLLGSSRSEGMPTDLFTTAEPRWLEVEVGQAKQPRVPAGRQGFGEPLDMGARGITDGETTFQQRRRGLCAQRRAARRIGPQDAGAVGAPQPHGGGARRMRGKPGIGEIDGSEYGLVHENSRNRRARRAEWRN